MTLPENLSSLMDWKRRVAELYAAARSDPDPHAAHRLWRTRRDDLFATHPQSPLPQVARAAFTGLDYFEYDPAYRVVVQPDRVEPKTYDVTNSDGSTYSFTRCGVLAFSLPSGACRLELYWLDGYGGGLFLPFRDATSGNETYAAGRYLIDTVKAADLGAADDGLILDFNFAYNPSCSYDPRWVCPLAPPPNRLSVPVQAGERSPGG